MGVLHRVHNQTNQQVHHRKCRDHDEGYKEHPSVGVNLHHRAHDPHRPGFQRHDLKQRIGAQPQIAEPLWKAGGKEFRGHHRTDIENQRHKQKHTAHTRQRRHKTFDHTAQTGGNRDDSQYPQDAQRPQHRKPARAGHQGNPDDHEIKQVPAIAEEPQPIGHQLGYNLGHKNAEADPVDHDDQWPCKVHGRLGSLKPKRDRVHDDHAHDERGNLGAFQPSGQLGANGHA
mmetsp:Transcript_18034/g.27597  ORF Transcript_18034/g.27597 Transcript_18034/m.27597 type:complete len:229 (+) Transcript_18034:10910-11596(+)